MSMSGLAVPNMEQMTDATGCDLLLSFPVFAPCISAHKQLWKLGLWSRERMEAAD